MTILRLNSDKRTQSQTTFFLLQIFDKRNYFQKNLLVEKENFPIEPISYCYIKFANLTFCYKLSKIVTHNDNKIDNSHFTHPQWEKE